MRRAIVIFGGFTEQWDEPTGQDKLYREAIRYGEFGSHDNLTLVFKRDWHDWKELAEWLERHNFSECFVCAYSWGAGYGLRKFAKAFSGPISCVLCDPVYRSKYPWMRWLALLKRQNVITYPQNVTVKRIFYQLIDEPGNDLVAGFEGKRTRLNAAHTKIDEHPAYHEAAIQEIESWLT